MKKYIIPLLLTAVALTGCPTTKKDTLYLPLKITDYNSLYGTNVVVIEYEYDDDLLGYKETFTYDSGFKSKEISSYRFSKDFKEVTELEEKYDYSKSKQEFYLVEKNRYEYTYSNKKDFVLKTYGYDTETDEASLLSIKEVKYDNYGRKILNIDKRPTSKENEFYYFNYITQEFDSNGYPIKYTSYSQDENDGFYSEPYVLYLDEYEYSSDYTTGKINNYEFDYDQNKLVEDGYTDVSLAKSANNFITMDCVSYFANGEKQSEYTETYDNMWRLVYYNYKNMNEEAGVERNEYDQISSYLYKSKSVTENVTFRYEGNGGVLVETKDDFDSDICECETVSTYSYLPNGQFKTAEQTTIGDDIDGETRTPFEREDSLLVEYTTIKNDKLHAQMGYEDFIRSSYAHYILNNSETLY